MHKSFAMVNVGVMFFFDVEFDLFSADSTPFFNDEISDTYPTMLKTMLWLNKVENSLPSN